MSYRMLSRTEKKKLIDKLIWDYDIDSGQLLELIEGKRERVGTFTETNLFARSLETFLWDDLINLWGLKNSIRLYNPQTRRMLFQKTLQEEYDMVFALLQGKEPPNRLKSAEERELLKKSFLFNRRNRCKNRKFSSPLLMIPE